MATKRGKAIMFGEAEVRAMGRSAAGVMGIKLAKDDEVVSMETIGKDKAKDAYLLVVSENGYGKRTTITSYRRQKRGGTGIKTTQVTAKTGNLVSALTLVGKEEYLMVISQKAQVIMIEIGGISRLGRSTQGVRIIRLDKDDKVASIACVAEGDVTGAVGDLREMSLRIVGEGKGSPEAVDGLGKLTIGI